MRAYIKFAIILAFALLIDRVGFAPHRHARAFAREANDDWPRCMNEISTRMNELLHQSNERHEQRDALGCWNLASAEHRRHCKRSHLADEINKQRDPVPASVPLYARLLDLFYEEAQGIFG